MKERKKERKKEHAEMYVYAKQRRGRVCVYKTTLFLIIKKK